MPRIRARWAILLAALFALSVAGSAHAYRVTVNVHGAGKVTETTPAALMNCTAQGSSESSTTSCTAGTTSGDYGWGWTVTLRASVPTDLFDRGWRFGRWVDANTGGRVNCDPEGTAGNHTSVDCTFRTYDNLAIDLYFEDVAAPDTTLSGGPSGSTKSTSATFTFNSGDPTANYECKLDAGQWSVCGSPSDEGQSYSGLPNGSHTFSVRAKDPTGNTDTTPASRTWTVDTIAPTVTINGSPGHQTVTNSTTASLGATATEGAPVTCRYDGGAPHTCGAPKSGLAEGAHTFTATATDAAGNTTVATRTWTVDLSVPQVSITGLPADGAITSATTADFEVSADAGTPTCTLDGAATDCNAPKAGLADGSHTFVATVEDAGGNTGTASRTWTIDTVAPSITISGEPAADSVTRATTALLDAAADEPATITCTLDGLTTACGAPKAGLGDGAHVFTVEAVDPAGNEGTASRAWTVDTAAPNTGITGGPAEGSATDNSAAFTFVSTEGGSTFECRLDGGEWASCVSPHILEGLASGEHAFEVRAIDAAGNVDDSPARRAWRVGTVDPGTGGGGTPPPGGETPLDPVSASLKTKWRVKGKRTWARRLRVSGLPQDAQVKIRCKGKRCPVKRKTGKPNAKGVVDVWKLLRKKPLRAGNRLTITITAPGGITRVVKVTIRKGKKPKVGGLLCLPAGASKPAAC